MNGSSVSTHIELSLVTAVGSGFFPFETIELKPGQMVWLQTQEGKDYRLSIHEGAGAEDFNIEIQGEDVLVHAPNGGLIVMRDYAIAVGDKPRSDFAEQLFYLREDAPNKEEKAAEEHDSDE